MRLQALFSHRDRHHVHLDALLHADDGSVVPTTVSGVRDDSGVLGVIIPATLDAWADELALVEIRERPGAVELRSGDTRVHLRTSAARA